jgi:hypothetical protein
MEAVAGIFAPGRRSVLQRTMADHLRKPAGDKPANGERTTATGDAWLRPRGLRGRERLLACGSRNARERLVATQVSLKCGWPAPEGPSGRLVTAPSAWLSQDRSTRGVSQCQGVSSTSTLRGGVPAQAGGPLGRPGVAGSLARVVNLVATTAMALSMISGSWSISAHSEPSAKGRLLTSRRASAYRARAWWGSLGRHGRQAPGTGSSRNPRRRGGSPPERRVGARPLRPSSPPTAPYCPPRMFRPGYPPRPDGGIRRHPGRNRSRHVTASSPCRCGPGRNRMGSAITRG